MSRLWSSGVELNTVTNDVEFSSNMLWSAAVSNVTVRSGTYSFQADDVASTSAIGHVFSTANEQSAYYARFYVYIATAPGATVSICHFTSNTNAIKAGIRLHSDRTLSLYNFEDSAQIGNASDPLSLSTWYLVELKCDTTTLASTAVEAKLNNTSFASGTINLALSYTCRAPIPVTIIDANLSEKEEKGEEREAKL